MKKYRIRVLSILGVLLMVVGGCSNQTKETASVSTLTIISRSEVVSISKTLLGIHNQDTYTSATTSINCSSEFRSKFFEYTNGIYPYNLSPPVIVVTYCGVDLSLSENTNKCSYFVIAKVTYNNQSTTVQLRLDFNGTQVINYERF